MSDEGDDVYHNFHRSGRFRDLCSLQFVLLYCSVFLAVCARRGHGSYKCDCAHLTKMVQEVYGYAPRHVLSVGFNKVKTQETASKLP